MALHVLDEANRCLGCKKPMCQQGCPIHTNIPEVIRLLKANELDAAGRMLFENNPLTTVCSLVCNHENQCEGHCIRNRMPSHDPVHFSIIEDYISTTYANKMTKGPAPKNGMKAAVVGAGPAGLTIAVLLARWGYDITIFDARDKIGGVMRYGIPNYRLPREVLDAEIASMLALGIDVHVNVNVGDDVTFDELRQQNDALYIALGAHTDKKTGIEGEDAEGVISAVEMLREIGDDHMPDFRNKDIVVIGGGNVAMDVCRSAVRLGARKVSCVYRRRQEDMTALPEEVEGAVAEGVELVTLQAPVRIETDANGHAVALWTQPQIIGEMDKKGRPAPEKAKRSEKRIAADVVVVAIGQGVETHGFEQTKIAIKRGAFVAEALSLIHI